MKLKKIFSNLKYKKLIIASTLFFILVGTRFFWEGKTGFFHFPTMIIQLICYFILVGIVIRYSYLIFKEKCQDKQRIFVVLFTFSVLIFTTIFPLGIEPKNNLLVVSSGRGTVPCFEIIYFRHNNRFIERDICFSMFERRGRFELRGDTIFPITFEKNSIFEVFKFAIISENRKDLYFYRDKNDSIPYRMRERGSPQF